MRSEFRWSSVDELFDVLSFFYMKSWVPTGVFAPPFRERLQQYVESDDEGVRLAVEDVVYEIFPMAQ